MRLLILGLVVSFALGCHQASHLAEHRTESHRPGVAESAEQIRPIHAGSTAPSAMMRTPDDQPVSMRDVYRLKPTVLVFYRGGWCPYCTKHLQELGQVEQQLRQMGFQIVAVSPDRPAAMRETTGDTPLNYTLLSDADAELAQAFGLAFRVDSDTVARYREYGIDLEAASGHDHHILPVPAVYLVDRSGTIRYAHWDADYKQRPRGDEIIEQARRIK